MTGDRYSSSSIGGGGQLCSVVVVSCVSVVVLVSFVLCYETGSATPHSQAGTC